MRRASLAFAILAVAVPAWGQDEPGMGMGMDAPEARGPAPVTTGSTAQILPMGSPTLTRELDELLEAAWKKAEVAPAPEVEATLLLRRLTLDLVGRAPTVDEVRGFRVMSPQTRVERAVNRLLESREHAEHVADVLSVVILGRETRRDGLDRATFRSWLAEKLHAGTPLDALVRELLTAKTDDARRDPASFYLLFGGDPADMAGRTARLFLGSRIQCAQCHDHPYEAWKRTDFWSLAAYFGRLRREEVREPRTEEMRRKRQQPRVITWKLGEREGGETNIPLQPGEVGRPALALPRFPGGTWDLALSGSKEPRLPALARAVTVERRPELAKALSNRIFALLFGRGIVHPVDDFSPQRPPELPEVLARLSRGLEEEEFKLRPFLRALALTRAYARSTGPGDGLDLFARARLRPLSPEALARTLATATRASEKEAQGLRERFVRLLARPDDEDPHSVQESVSQALVLLNGPEVNRLCAPRPGTTVGLAAAEPDLEARLSLIYDATLSRAPTDEELAEARTFFGARKDAKKATEDYFWSIVNSSEFLYNH